MDGETPDRRGSGAVEGHPDATAGDGVADVRGATYEQANARDATNCQMPNLVVGGVDRQSHPSEVLAVQHDVRLAIIIGVAFYRGSVATGEGGKVAAEVDGASKAGGESDVVGPSDVVGRGDRRPQGTDAGVVQIGDDVVRGESYRRQMHQ